MKSVPKELGYQLIQPKRHDTHWPPWLSTCYVRIVTWSSWKAWRGDGICAPCPWCLSCSASRTCGVLAASAWYADHCAVETKANLTDPWDPQTKSKWEFIILQWEFPFLKYPPLCSKNFPPLFSNEQTWRGMRRCSWWCFGNRSTGRRISYPPAEKIIFCTSVPDVWRLL